MHRRLILLAQQRGNSMFPQSHFNFSSLSHERKHIDENPEARMDIRAYLFEACLTQCKRIHARRMFDEMPQRISRALETGKVIHGLSVKFGFQSDRKLGNAVLDLYSKCGSLEFTEKVFNRLEQRDVLAWNSFLSMYSRIGLLEKVVGSFGSMKDAGVVPNQFTYASVLSASTKLVVIGFGKQVHCDVIKTGFDCDPFCESSLTDMYVKFKCLNDARQVIDQVANPSIVSWTAMISAYTEMELLEAALQMVETMKKEGCVPDQVAFVAVISAFIRLGRISEAYDLFSQMPDQDAVAWNLMISGHLKNGHEAEAIKLFMHMRKADVKATRSTFASVLSAVASMEAFHIGLSVHAQAIKQGLERNVYVGSSLISMYAKCQNLIYAREVFDSSDDRNIILWNAMLGGYAQNGLANQVVKLFVDMKQSGLVADEFTYTSILSACGCLGSLQLGHQLHSHIIKNRFQPNLFVCNALVDMYAKSGALTEARWLFELMKDRDNVSWNAIIVGHAQEEEEYEALDMFKRMMADGPPPDEVALASIWSACADLEDVDLGRAVHCVAVKYGLETGLYAGSSLIDMYVKCGIISAAYQVFYCMPRWNVVSMNALIAGYSQQNLEEAVKLYQTMQAKGLHPSEITFTNLLDACHGPFGIILGRQIHCLLLKDGLLYRDEVLGISLLSMYMNCLLKTDASNLFSEFPNPKGTILWTAMISGLNQNESSGEALQLYREMRCSNILPDQATFACVLKACSTLASIRDGVKIHCFLFHAGFSVDELVGSALIDMYAKCGDVKISMQLFKEMDSKWDVITWNSMIAGFAKNGHAGRTSEGRKVFDLMTDHFGIQPRMDHSACMIDLLGRQGLLDEAENLINKLEVVPDAILASFLSACRLHGDEVRGRRAANKLIELEASNSSAYSLLANIYASSGNWNEVKALRRQMRENGVQKLPGFSWLGEKENKNVHCSQ
ncbi:hypothetical protein Dimus_005452 [Dionaea muscipula]